MKIRTQFQESEQSSGYNNNPGKTMTVPDQGLTIQQLLERHSRGVSLGVPDKKGEYFDTEIPRHDDLTDVLVHKYELEKKAKDLETQIKKQKAKKTQSIKEKSEDKVSQAETVAKPTEK